MFCDQPVHNSGSSGYSSLPRNDNVFSTTSSSDDNCCGDKMQEEGMCSKSRPVSPSRRSSSAQCLVESSGPLGPMSSRRRIITADPFFAISQRTFQEICKGIHRQKSQEQQANEADNKKNSSSKIS